MKEILKQNQESDRIEGSIFSIQKFSIHDGPGLRTTVFLKGCPLSCRWCANPESQKAGMQILYEANLCVGCGRCIKECPHQALSLDPQTKKIVKDHAKCTHCQKCVGICLQNAWSVKGEKKTAKEVVEICLQDCDFYEQSGGGVTFSGGEALIQGKFLIAMADLLKQNGIHTAIETTGFVDHEAFKQAADRLDLFLFDVKHYTSAAHLSGTGVPNEKILNNLSYLIQAKKDFLCRIPVIPGFNASLEDAQGFCDLFNRLGVKRVQLLPFHQMGEKKYSMLDRDYKYQQIKALHPEDLQAYAKTFHQNGIDAFF